MHHLHQSDEQAQLVGRKANRKAIIFLRSRTQPTAIFLILTSDWSRAQRVSRFRACLEAWDKGDNGILDYSKAYRLKPGTGWLVPPRILHAPGSLLTYEPQWGSDVLAMFQSMVEGAAGAAQPAHPGRSRGQALRLRFPGRSG